MSREAEVLLKQLLAEGVSVWLAPSGTRELDAALRGGTLGDDCFQSAVLPPACPTDLVQRACDALLPRFHSSKGAAGLVSVPVHPKDVHDTESLLTAARTLHGGLRRPNALVRIPMTTTGVAVLADCLAEGIGVDASLVLSAERYAEVLDAYVEGMERALTSGHRLAEIPTVTSFPVGVFDREVDARLDRLGTDHDHTIRGTAGVALARRMYRLREERLGGDWWRLLTADGARPPRLLWTDGGPHSVAGLIGWNTAHVLSEQTFEEAAQSVELSGDTLLNADLEGRSVLQALERLGVRAGQGTGALETAELDRLQRCWDVRTARVGALCSERTSSPGRAAERT